MPIFNRRIYIDKFIKSVRREVRGYSKSLIPMSDESEARIRKTVAPLFAIANGETLALEESSVSYRDALYAVGIKFETMERIPWKIPSALSESFGNFFTPMHWERMVEEITEMRRFQILENKMEQLLPQPWPRINFGNIHPSDLQYSLEARWRHKPSSFDSAGILCQWIMEYTIQLHAPGRFRRGALARATKFENLLLHLIHDPFLGQSRDKKTVYVLDLKE